MLRKNKLFFSSVFFSSRWVLYISFVGFFCWIWSRRTASSDVFSYRPRISILASTVCRSSANMLEFFKKLPWFKVTSSKKNTPTPEQELTKKLKPYEFYLYKIQEIATWEEPSESIAALAGVNGIFWWAFWMIANCWPLDDWMIADPRQVWMCCLLCTAWWLLYLSLLTARFFVTFKLGIL